MGNDTRRGPPTAWVPPVCSTFSNPCIESEKIGPHPNIGEGHPLSLRDFVIIRCASVGHRGSEWD